MWQPIRGLNLDGQPAGACGVGSPGWLAVREVKGGRLTASRGDCWTGRLQLCPAACVSGHSDPGRTAVIAPARVGLGAVHAPATATTGARRQRTSRRPNPPLWDSPDMDDGMSLPMLSNAMVPVCGCPPEDCTARATSDMRRENLRSSHPHTLLHLHPTPNNYSQQWLASLACPWLPRPCSVTCPS